jgi:hypothetical protein
MVRPFDRIDGGSLRTQFGHPAAADASTGKVARLRRWQDRGLPAADSGSATLALGLPRYRKQFKCQVLRSFCQREGRWKLTFSVFGLARGRDIAATGVVVCQPRRGWKVCRRHGANGTPERVAYESYRNDRRTQSAEASTLLLRWAMLRDHFFYVLGTGRTAD